MVTKKAKSSVNTPNGIQLFEIEETLSKENFFIEESFKYFTKIEEINRRMKIDIVEVPEWLGQGYFLSTESNLPIVTRLHTPLFLIEEKFNQSIYRKGRVIKEFEKIQIVRSTGCTSPSKALAEIVFKECQVNSEVIPNPLLTEKKEESDVQGKYLENTIVFLGRLEYRKGVLTFGKALQQIMKENRKVNVIFCGKDTLYQKKSVRKQLEEMIDDYQERITFIPHVSGIEKKELLQKANVVVVPSIWENFPYVCLEAMSYGCSVIASNVGGLSEIINDEENGYLFEVANPVELSKKLLEIFKSGRNYNLQESARQTIRRKYSGDVIGSQLEIYYKYILDKK